MAGLANKPMLRDAFQNESMSNDENGLYPSPISEIDAWALSLNRPGNMDVTNPKHAGEVQRMALAAAQGQLSEKAIFNITRLNPRAAAPILDAYGQYKQSSRNKAETQSLIGKYINPGSPAVPEQPYTEQDVGSGVGALRLGAGIPGTGRTAVPPTQNPQGLVNEFARLGNVEMAQKYADLYGINKSQGRGEYYVPIQTASGIKAFNARTGMIEDASKLPVVGSASDPALQGALSGAKSHGAAVGKDVAGAGNLADSGIAISNASKILDKGIYTGAWGPTQKEIAKRFPGADKTTASNTEEFLSYVGNVVIPMMKDLGGSDTVEELNYMKSLVAGDVSMEKTAIRNVLAATQKKIAARQARLKAQAKTVGLGAKAESATGEPNQEQPKKNKVFKFSELP